MNRILIWMIWGIAIGSLGCSMLILNGYILYGFLCIPLGGILGVIAYGGYQLFQKGKKK